MRRQLAYQVCYVIAAVAAFGGAARAGGIATVTDVVNEGYRTPPGREELIAKRADVSPSPWSDDEGRSAVLNNPSILAIIVLSDCP